MNNLICSKVSHKQVRKELADPKAAPKQKKGSRTKTLNQTSNKDSRNNSGLPSQGPNMPSNTFTAFSKFMGDSKATSQSKLRIVRSPNEMAREKAMSDMDTFITK